MHARTSTALPDVGVFGALAPADQERLASLFRPRSFAAGQAIFMQGDEGLGMYIIGSGKVKICANDRQGKEVIFSFLTSGDLLGEIAILDGGPRSATAIAVAPTDTLYIDRAEFITFLRSSPNACIDIIAQLCATLRRVSTRLEEVSFLDVAGRVARNLVGLAGGHPGNQSTRKPLYCDTSQEELASAVGASRVMVNKVLKSFADLGFITLARRKITILNPLELNRIGGFNIDA